MALPGTGGGAAPEVANAPASSRDGKDVRLHDLRHFAATMAAQAGATVPELMARLGHATPDASMIYLHKTKLHDAEITRKLTELARPEAPTRKLRPKK